MNRLQNVFQRRPMDRPPFWLMRQAGRYLPEYRKVRETCPNFFDLCYSPDKAMEVTLQPLRRFDMDAAIIFSDILVIPQALGIKVWFEKDEGPRLEELRSLSQLKPFSSEKLSPVYEAISKTRNALNADKSLIGFAGGPWTLACYMLREGIDKEFTGAREKMYTDEVFLKSLLEILADSVAEHLIRQVKAGADVVQIFESWAGLVPASHRQVVLVEPVRRIVKAFKKSCPHIPVIAFPRGLTLGHQEYAEETGIDALSVDTVTPLPVCDKVVIQGNLDPIVLATSKEKTIERTKKILQAMSGRPFIFNLGHGILPQTPIEHVEALAETVKHFKP